MKPIYIFRHLACEGPGFLQDVLDEYNIPTQLISIDQNDPVPKNIDNCSALVFMGGPMSVNDSLQWIEPELNLIRLAVDRHIPVLGHCLGGQLISKALGGVITQNPVKEIGWHEVSISESPISKAWCPTLPNKFTAFHWHGETFTIPAGATYFMASELCENQAFFMGNCLAFQCHIEMTVAMVNEWANEYEEELREPNIGIQSQGQMLEKIEQKIQNLQVTAKTIYRQWLSPLIDK